MKITKVLNNNVAVALDKSGKETVVMGRGLAFQKRTGDEIHTPAIEKVFSLQRGDQSSRLQELVTEMPLEHIRIGEKIIQYAKLYLGSQLDDSVYITICDHVSCAIERSQQGIALKNAILWDIRHFYPDEYMIGEKALEIIYEEAGVRLPEDEAAFIGLHLVNAQIRQDIGIVYDMTKLIQEITNIVKYRLTVELDQSTVNYYRFINHLKFFSLRVLQKKTYDDEDAGLLEIVRGRYPPAYDVAEDIAQFILQNYDYRMTSSELLYIVIHIVKNVKDANKSRDNQGTHNV